MPKTASNLAKRDAAQPSENEKPLLFKSEPVKGNRFRRSLEGLLIFFAVLLVIIGLFHLFLVVFFPSLEKTGDEFEQTAFWDKNFYTLPNVDLTQVCYLRPVDVYEQNALYIYPLKAEQKKPAVEATAMGTTKAGYTLYRADWLEKLAHKDGVALYALKLSKTDQQSKARFLAVCTKPPKGHL